MTGLLSKKQATNFQLCGNIHIQMMGQNIAFVAGTHYNDGICLPSLEWRI